MHALIVVAHPDPRSLTHGVAVHLADGITLSDAGHSVEIADLAAEGFDPRFTAADIALHLREGVLPADVAAEQARIDRADALVLVYPVYWWSMPGLLKGWIDRVFTNGWAYDDRADAGVVKLLGRLPVHLVGLGGADAGTYARHEYFAAIKTQIDHGIFDYCGARVVTSELMLEAGPDQATAHLEAARTIGRRLFKASGRSKAADAA
ncbi:NAD(P)H-dependent oxidoreductase [Rhizobium leguminosarum]|uniref:NAD(P)H-dependent oxidoreductase n=1 Tax=Rhizobium leguminosarum TaxID=384 RepID=UPI001C9685D5|nr:NAD(P)H-dependent oxidoreductase [Rhizobium leguminosarum]MBY5333134.1 NAD(P)H-dependent oxidoreductase [Rhizobium leguminosarum]